MARKRSHPLLAAKNRAWWNLRRFEHEGGERGSAEHRQLELELDQAGKRHDAAGAPRFAEKSR